MSNKKTASELRQDYVDALGVEDFKCIHLQPPDGKCIDCGDCEYNKHTPLEIEAKRMQREHDRVKKCARKAWAAGVQLAREVFDCKAGIENLAKEMWDCACAQQKATFERDVAQAERDAALAKVKSLRKQLMVVAARDD